MIIMDAQLNNITRKMKQLKYDGFIDVQWAVENCHFFLAFIVFVICDHVILILLWLFLAKDNIYIKKNSAMNH